MFHLTPAPTYPDTDVICGPERQPLQHEFNEGKPNGGSEPATDPAVIEMFLRYVEHSHIKFICQLTCLKEGYYVYKVCFIMYKHRFQP